VKVARVSYDTGEGAGEGIVAEEIAIERELDREKFREQKKGRAISQKRVTKAQPQIKAKVGVVEIPSSVSVKEFSEKAGLPVTDVIAALFRNGIMATINQRLDYETAAVIAADLGVEVKMVEHVATSEELLAGDLKALLKEEDPSVLRPRPPIVTVMGHVDHGKTKLLDTIRHTNVMGGESGGITQHIGAYQVEKNGRLITFLDTPGHEAFASMRARGAKVTDIAILVVAADEGVKPQTVEALNHAKEAGVPIIVAINKMDKPGANVDKVKSELVEYGLQSEDWGGKNIMVPVSALNGTGVDHLLEMVLLVADVENLKANPKRMAVGTVVEANLDPSLGPVATILVNTGTLHVGDSIVVGTTLGRVKTMKDDKGKDLKEVPPSGAVRISGLDMVPKAGDIVQSFKSEKMAKARLEKIIELKLQQGEELGGSMVERIVNQISTGDMKFLKVVLKADVKGSLEAILQALAKIKGKDVAVKVIHYGVGNVTGTDVAMAAASQALIVGFHVDVSTHIKKLAEADKVDIKLYTVIYHLIEEIKAYLSGMLLPEITVVELGKMEVKQIFLDKKVWVIAGCVVTEGKVEKGAMVRVKRNGELLFETQLESLKVVQQDVRELDKGSECGIRIKTHKPVLVGDTLEVYRIDRKERTL
jgi:translation initiation factor IF-2